MKKKHGMLCLLCMFAAAVLCACQGMAFEREPAPGEEPVPAETEPSDLGTTFLDAYNQVFAGMQGGRAALIYLDRDCVPELLILKDGEYQMYFFDGSAAKRVPLPDEGMRANAYGTRYAIESMEDSGTIFYWFEYALRKGLVRVHGEDGGKRRDYYLAYGDGTFDMELAADDEGYTWNTYDAGGEITNETFSDRLAELGYDCLVCCTYLYEDVETAYENMERMPDARRAMEDFVSGKANAVECVESRCETPEQGFWGRNFAEINEEATAGEPWWEGVEYVDFDNDGEEELIMHGYAGARLYFDAVGDRVVKVLETAFTTEISCVAELDGKRVVVKTDLTHGGRQYYWVMTYDGCGCLTDWFRLSAGYEGMEYGAGDRYEYRGRAISMEEFEAIRDSIHGL
jgi:hypothetical protein|nr:hypothetical protein [uncultured Acetatifactor sp.]